jgi:membrane protein insertase Oxa1/YidC/SpoIIIJ
MRKIPALLLLMASWIGGFSAFSSAQSKNTYSQPKSVTKLDKKHAKAQKKYAKQQKKAQQKMVKTSKKNTHIPPQQF